MTALTWPTAGLPLGHRNPDAEAAPVFAGMLHDGYPYPLSDYVEADTRELAVVA